MPRTPTGQVLEWLLEPSNPTIRYLTLTRIQSRPEEDTEVAAARAAIPRSSWVRKVMAGIREGSYWVNPKSCYPPKYTATVWRLQLLAELLMPGADPRIEKACRRFLDEHAMHDGGFSCGSPSYSGRYSEECLVGRMLATFARFGFLEDSRVEYALEWLLSRQLPDGGWNCRYRHKPSHSSIYTTYMALWGLSELPERVRSRSWKDAIEHGVEFMLRQRLCRSHRTGKIIKRGWLETKFPPNIGYDVLMALRLMKRLGVTYDRLRDAREVMTSKMRVDGRWLLDRVPVSWREQARGKATMKLEAAGRPSKWVTTVALEALGS